MQTIYRYALTITGRQSVEMPVGAKFVHVHDQEGCPTVWVECDPEKPLAPRDLFVVGTGWNQVVGNGEQAIYRGTSYSGSFVWHVYEICPRPNNVESGSPMTEEQEADVTARYAAALHKVQSGIALDIPQLGEAGAGASPKHLRVGMNSALSSIDAIAQLLIAKGIFTSDEYAVAVMESMEREADAAEKRVQERYCSTKIRLG